MVRSARLYHWIFNTRDMYNGYINNGNNKTLRNKILATIKRPSNLTSKTTVSIVVNALEAIQRGLKKQIELANRVSFGGDRSASFL